MNYTNGQKNSLSTQQADLANMAAVGVNLIRIPFIHEDEQSSVNLAALAQTYGIATEFSVYPPFPSTAPFRAFNPSFPDLFAEFGWSGFDLNIYRTWLRTWLIALRNAGVTIAGWELGNEPNWAPFNGDFPVPGTGKIYAGASTPTMQTVYAGLALLGKGLEVTRWVREEQSMTFPIFSAGMADNGPLTLSGVSVDGQPVDGTTIASAIDAMGGTIRAADGIGIHMYPSTSVATGAAAARLSKIQSTTLSRCANDRPCYVTEWGFSLSSLTCPVTAADVTRQALTQEILNDMNLYGSAVVLGMWYDWSGNAKGVYQCSGLTGTGTLVLP